MDKSIKFGIVLTNNETSEHTARVLLNYGIPSLIIHEPLDNLALITPDETKFIFIDLDYYDNLAFQFLDALATRDGEYSYLTIATSFTATESLIKKLQEYNLVSFLVKPLNNELLKNKMEQIIKKFEDHFPARKHVRIKPDPDETMRANFKFGENYYSCKVLDISTGGIAAEIYKQNADFPFTQNDRIEEMEINIGLKEITVSGEIISLKSKLIALKFTGFEANSYEILSKYILAKISV